MPDLFIDGRRRSPLTSRTREIRCPADGTLVAVVVRPVQVAGASPE
ncbi:hypothetical protein ACF05W_16355 [Streptomyces lydicus]